MEHTGAMEYAGESQQPARAGRFGSLIYAARRAMNHEKLGKIFLERLTEPLHLNLISPFVLLFGSTERKIAFDLVVRQQFAFSILHAAQLAAAQGLERISIAEFGVASGAGLQNMCAIAADVMRATKVAIDIYGFDTGTGMPKPVDYRDHPEHWQQGDFPMEVDRLRQALPPFAHLIIGDVETTIPRFLADLSPQAPLGFVSLDLDFYSSTAKALSVFQAAPALYLPTVVVYLDDIVEDTTNPWCGEQLAVAEFNAANALRKIAPFPLLRTKRIFKNARWIDQIYLLHVFDHESRRPAIRRGVHVLPNEYLGVRPAVAPALDAD